MNDISRWAGTPQGLQVLERSATYTDADWRAFRAELSAIHLKILAAMRAGTPPGDSAVLDLVEEHRSHVSRWQYDCDHDTHRQLADLYLTTNRLARSYEDMAPGLTMYLHQAMAANYERWVSRQCAPGPGPVPGC